MLDEGYIKFDLNWVEQELAVGIDVTNLQEIRKVVWTRGWIGEEEGVGFGNISTRFDNRFIISGTQTGAMEELSRDHWTVVEDWDIEKNKIDCRGPIKASSESLTHAAIYQADHKIKAVIHIHSSELWNKGYELLPSTAEEIAYGTVRMAEELVRLVNETGDIGLVLMKGHRDGLIAYGPSLETALNQLIHFADGEG